MLQDMKLSTRFTIMLLAVFTVGVLASGVALWRSLQQRAQLEVSTQAVLLMEGMNAVRSYTSGNIRPLLADELYTGAEFIPETVPAFSAKTVFDRFRTLNDHESFIYREATLNPTNPDDRADDFEEDLVNELRANPDTSEMIGFRDIGEQELFYIARPLAIGSESCLDCHSEPSAAPASLIATYGDQNGFGWQLNEIVAAQVIYVPAEEVFSSARSAFAQTMLIFVVTFIAVILVINRLLHRYVLQPVMAMDQLAIKVCQDELEMEDLEAEELTRATQQSGELGYLASLLRMMAREVHERTQSLKNQVRQLRIEIDTAKRQQQVEEVVDSDFFQDLQSRAKELRERRDKQREDDPAES